MKPVSRADVLIGVAFALAGGFVAIHSTSIRSIPGLPVGPGLFPAVTGIAMAVFGLVLAVQGWFSREVPPPKAAHAPAGLLDRLFIPILLVSLGLVILVMPWLGFIITGTLFAVLVVLLCGGGWIGALLFSPAATVVIYMVFVHALRVPLPRGLLG